MSTTPKRSWRRRVGRVTVYQRGGTLWIYYRQGHPVRRPVGTSREEALALAAKINAQLADGAPTMLAFQPIAVTAMSYHGSVAFGVFRGCLARWAR